MDEYELHKKLESLKEYKFLKKKLEKLFSEVKVEIAHVIDYIVNGEKEKLKYHDEEFQKIFKK